MMGRFEIKTAASSDLFGERIWDHGFFGTQVDDRGGAAISFVRNHSVYRHEVSYNADSLQISINGVPYSVDDYGLHISQMPGTVIIETTTLSFAEILLICHARCKLTQDKIAFIYVEPEQYRRPRRDLLLQKRHFQLTARSLPFSPIPPFLLKKGDSRDAHVLFLLGYEGQRLRGAMEQIGFNHARTSLLFGVPAFQAGWEMDSFANNYSIIEEGLVSRSSVFFGAANCPEAAYGKMISVHGSLERGTNFVICPIGTKPHSVATTVFACDHENVGVMYDNPVKLAGRSDRVHAWHIYEAAFPK